MPNDSIHIVEAVTVTNGKVEPCYDVSFDGKTARVFNRVNALIGMGLRDARAMTVPVHIYPDRDGVHRSFDNAADFAESFIGKPMN